MRKTQIVATIGPACDQEDCLEQMIQAGMNIARFNTKHNMPAWHQVRVEKVRNVAKKLGKEVGILLDLQGPEIRIKLLSDPSFPVQKDEFVFFTDDPASCHESKVVSIPGEVVVCIEVGHHLILEDGACEFEVVEKNAHVLKAKALDSFTVKTDKTMNTPNTELVMPSLLDKDIQFLEDLQKDNIDYIGLSFVRDKKDIDILRGELNKRNMKSKIVAKIETGLAIKNLAEIIDAADAVMVARGDLAVEIPYYQVPFWQKEIIKQCNQKGKFVITATQMMLSMMEKPRPTRAEISDVANAVYDGTNAVMLSEESAMGKYPVKTIQTQAQIVEYYDGVVLK